MVSLDKFPRSRYKFGFGTIIIIIFIPHFLQHLSKTSNIFWILCLLFQQSMLSHQHTGCYVCPYPRVFIRQEDILHLHCTPPSDLHQTQHITTSRKIQSMKQLNKKGDMQYTTLPITPLTTGNSSDMPSQVRTQDFIPLYRSTIN